MIPTKLRSQGENVSDTCKLMYYNNYVISPIFLSGSSSSERPWSTNQLLKSLSVVLLSQIISNTEPTTTNQANFVLPAISHGLDYQ